MLSTPVLLALALAASPSVTPKPTLVRAAPLRTGEIQSPRRLFNTGLQEEEQGNLTRAVQFYLSARLSLRRSIADELYARGAAYRLVRILAGYDDDAAAAAALLVASETLTPTSDLAPLIRTLLRRLDEGRHGPDLQAIQGVIASIRYRARDDLTVIELEEGSERRLILTEGVVGPVSAGDRVRVMVRRDRKHAIAGWRLIAIGAVEGFSWQMLAVSGLPGDAGEAQGALLGSGIRH
jgi:hypothetical protein